MVKNFLTDLPSPDKLLGNKISPGRILNANCHVHTPYSFSAFDSLDALLTLAYDEGIEILGINDFFVTDGFETFHNGCLEKRIFPLFNIEFIGLLKKEQEMGIRINDPNNPGRIYFSGKALDFPFHLDSKMQEILYSVREETQNQLRLMTGKLNALIASENPGLNLSFDDIKKDFAKELVRERHLAKALRCLIERNFITIDSQLDFLAKLYGGKQSKTGMANKAALENEIRSNLLKAGGSAFVEEDEKTFLDIKTVIGIIIDAGGIPCYPVLLDDSSGKITEYEENKEKLDNSLSELGVKAIELIPGRNEHNILESFAEWFDNKGYIVTFGTEHNTPEMIPLTVSARGLKSLSMKLAEINSKGVAVLAAHQYLRARGLKGFTNSGGRAKSDEIAYFKSLGMAVIDCFLKKDQDEN